MSSSVETLECYMEEMVDCFEDFIKKSLVIMTLAIGALIGILMYLLKTIHSTERRSAVGAQTNIERTLAPTIANLRSSSSSSSISTRRESSPCGITSQTCEEFHLVGKDKCGRLVQVESKENLTSKKSTSICTPKKATQKCPARQNQKKCPARGTSCPKMKKCPENSESKTCLKKPASDSCCSRTSSCSSIIMRESAPNVRIETSCVKKVPCPRIVTESKLTVSSLPTCPSQIPKCRITIKAPACSMPKGHPARQGKPSTKGICNKPSCCSKCCDDDPR